MSIDTASVISVPSLTPHPCNKTAARYGLVHLSNLRLNDLRILRLQGGEMPVDQKHLHLPVLRNYSKHEITKIKS